ncbi:MAG: autotransporter domain-containing protein [Pseudomonadota bacterium]
MSKTNFFASQKPACRCLPLALALAGIFSASAQADDPAYTLLGPNTYGGMVSSDGSAGIVGANAFRVFRWSSTGTIDLGTLGGNAAFAGGISSDGSVVVGSAGVIPDLVVPNTDLVYHGFRWTSAGMVDLGTLGGKNSAANGVSSDGNTVVGNSDIADDLASHAFRWTSAGMIDLGTLVKDGGGNSQAVATSDDGSVVIGSSSVTKAGNGGSHAFRWTSAGMVDLGTLGGANSHAYAISRDGSTVAGVADTSASAVANSPTAIVAGASVGGVAAITATFRAVRWTSGGIADLGTLGGSNSFTTAMSNDGSVVVGNADTANNAASHAFRWTGAGMVDLGTLGTNANSNSYAMAVSGNGSIVVGYSDATNVYGRTAFRWSQSTGMQSVADWMAAAKVTLPIGLTLVQATGSNLDGSVIVGNGAANGHAEAWIARIPTAVVSSGFIPTPTPGTAPVPNTGGFIVVRQFNQSVSNTSNAIAQIGASLPGLSLNGAHHRTLLDSGLARSENGSCAWATADAAHLDSSRSDMQLAEAGVCKDFAATRVGFGVGQAWTQQSLDQDGRAKYDGQYLIAEIDHIFNHGIEASLTGYYGRFDANIKRNYQNGATIDTSIGNTTATSTAVRLRLDWLDMARLGRFTLSPYTAYAWSQIKMGAYAETGGSFPVAYSSDPSSSNDLRVGLTGKAPLSATTDLRLSAEAIHRFESSTGANVEVTGLYSFSVAGQSVRQNWARVNADIDHRLTNSSLLTVGVNAGTTGGDPSWGVTAGCRMSF